MGAALDATRFVDEQRLAGRNAWRRTPPAAAGDTREPAVNRSLYYGSAGVVLLLLELAEATGDSARLDEAVAAGEDIVAYLDGVDRQSVSVSRGWPGYGFVLTELAAASGRDEFTAAAARCYERLRAQATPLGAGIGWIEPAPFAEITGFSGEREIYDQSVGAAGAALALLHAHRHGVHPDALRWAAEAGDRLLEVGEPDPAGTRWVLMADMPFPFTAPNFAHGGAGVGYFLLQLQQSTGDARYLDAALSAARYVESRGTWMGDGAARGMLVCHTEEARQPIFYLGACHGPPGTGRLFLELHRVTGDDHWLELAHALWRGAECLGAPEQRSVGLWNNHSQCCGDAALGEYALLMAQRTGDGGYLDAARRCADVMIASSVVGRGDGGTTRHWVQAEHRDRPTFVEAQIGYMQGAAGIASFLIHLSTTLAGAPVKIALPDWPTRN
ncbi:MAG: lanthionine synthetase LanC family protein [Ilumatobacteraceae bacterium]